MDRDSETKLYSRRYLTAKHIDYLQSVASLSSIVKMFCYRFGVDHFTIPASGAQYLQAIRPDYIKANSAYLQDMMFDHDTRKTQESFNNLIRSLGISIVAINIEDAKEVENLKALGADRFQWTHIAQVTLLQ
ncbi:EAL domain-containing protein [Sulfuricurvum sp.]|uniref:EAL domain-containing protein n=1 Tax=Sulfuricurvum sp. TaxID=2025608 RepID=UPI0019BEFF9B|nr:EAL domain-containing protein [Sulfuricurvum sp.]MBD3805798.1 EAL domain-containing protein [Sulfuricurvum sp.]